MLRLSFLNRTACTSAVIGMVALGCGTEPDTCTVNCGSTTDPSATTTASVGAGSSSSVQPIPPGPTGASTSPTTTGPTGGMATTAPSGGTATTGPSGTTGPVASTTEPSGTSGPTATTTGPDTTVGETSTLPNDSSEPGPEPSGDPNPSGFPEPGDGGVARPSGTAGNLQVVPWAGFTGALSYTFDDATGSQHGNKDAMFALGVRFTWYLANGAGGDPMNPMYAEARDLGHELGNHTQNHREDAADAEAMQGWLMTNYQVVGYTLAAPNGRTQPFEAITAEKFLLNRGVNGGSIGADGNTNWLNLPSNIPAQGAGESVFRGYADTAATGRWQTVCIHGFTTGGTGGYQPVDFNGWRAGVEYAKTKNVWITSMVDVAAYLIGGKAVSDATPTADGANQKWTWTLEDTFPPDRYVRVKVDGGTLMQDGQALPWNDHGFYEVALDVGELTLAP